MGTRKNPIDFFIDPAQNGRLADFSADFRTMIILRDIQELSYDEVSKIMDLPLGTVKSRINRGRLKLQESLRKKGE